MENIDFKAILKIIVDYFLAIFVHFGYITEEDIDSFNDFVDEFKPAE